MSAANQTPPDIEADLAKIAAALSRAAKRLTPRDRRVDVALKAVADTRHELERIERELVTLARASGRTWAEIGADLNIIIPRRREANPAAGARYARRRQSVEGAGINGDGAAR